MSSLNRHARLACAGLSRPLLSLLRPRNIHTPTTPPHAYLSPLAPPENEDLQGVMTLVMNRKDARNSLSVRMVGVSRHIPSSTCMYPKHVTVLNRFIGNERSNSKSILHFSNIVSHPPITSMHFILVSVRSQVQIPNPPPHLPIRRYLLCRSRPSRKSQNVRRRSLSIPRFLTCTFIRVGSFTHTDCWGCRWVCFGWGDGVGFGMRFACWG